MKSDVLPIRILNLFTIMDRGGAETMCMNLYRNMDRSKVQFDFLVYFPQKGAYDDEIEQLGGKIYRISQLKDLSAHLRDARLFFTNHPEYEIIHNHMGENGGLICRTARKAGVRTIICHSHAQPDPLFDWNCRIMFRRLLYRILYRIAKKNSTDFYACGVRAAKAFDSAGQVTVLNNAIDLDRFKYSPAVREKIRSELKCDNRFVIGHVGRMDANKNQMFLLKVFRELLKAEPDSLLVLVGDGVMRKELERESESLGIAGKTRFLGVRSDVNAILQALDVFVLPSISEGLPVSCIEAQAAGLPCVFSDSFDPETAVTDNCRLLSLADPVEKWVETVLGFRDFERKDLSPVIRAAGYDIRETAKRMENFYLDRAGRKT